MSAIPATDHDQLRAFEQRMQNEGSDAFAAGPAPWDSWNVPEQGGEAFAWRNLEVGSKHEQHDGMSKGERILSALVSVLIAVLLAGITGVYLSGASTHQMMAEGIRPQPLARDTYAGMDAPARHTYAGMDAPARVTGLPVLDALPAPAAGADSVDSEAALPATTAETGDSAADPLYAMAPPAHAQHAGNDMKHSQPSATVQASAPDEPVAQPGAGNPAAPPATQQVMGKDTAGLTPVSAVTTAQAVPAGTAGETLPEPEQPVGKYVVNLASYDRESAARHTLEQFRKKGVDAELATVDVNGRTLVRIRTTGHRTWQEASEWVTLLEERLGLEGVWVSKR